MEWDSNTAWRKQVERRLYELGAMAKGQIPIQADRISDLLEQLDELRAEVKRIADKQDKIAEYVKKNVKPQKENGDDHESQ